MYVCMYVWRRFAVISFNCFLLLSAVQLTLIILKISSQFTSINWSAVLLPLWIILGFFCVLPCCQDVGKFRMDPALYLGCMVLFWAPLVIFFVCLAVKLQTKNSHIRVALMFVPLWIIEGIVILLNMFYLFAGIIRSVPLGMSFSFVFVCLYIYILVCNLCMYVCMYIWI